MWTQRKRIIPKMSQRKEVRDQRQTNKEKSKDSNNKHKEHTETTRKRSISEWKKRNLRGVVKERHMFCVCGYLVIAITAAGGIRVLPVVPRALLSVLFVVVVLRKRKTNQLSSLEHSSFSTYGGVSLCLFCFWLSEFCCSSYISRIVFLGPRRSSSAKQKKQVSHVTWNLTKRIKSCVTLNWPFRRFAVPLPQPLRWSVWAAASRAGTPASSSALWRVIHKSTQEKSKEAETEMKRTEI